MPKPIKREGSGSYVLTVLISLVLTITVTRVYLEFTGYPIIGNDDLHFAHALWGGLILFIANLLPMMFINPWAMKASALLSGLGMGLFIDEVGKFITQSNDYFSPLAVPVIIVFLLLVFLTFLYFRREEDEDPRQAVLQVLEELKAAVDNDLDPEKVKWMKSQLKRGKTAVRKNIAELAEVIDEYLD